jgi:hypothetical protein
LICKHVKVVLDRIVGPVQRVINDIARKKRVEEYERGESEVEEPSSPLDKNEDGNPVLPYVPRKDKEKTEKPELEPEVAPVDEEPVEPIPEPEPEPTPEPDDEEEARRAEEEAKRKELLRRRRAPEGGEDARPSRPGLQELQGGPAPKPKRPRQKDTREDLPRVKPRGGVLR